MLNFKISDLIRKLERDLRQHGDIPVIAAHYMENDDPDSPYPGYHALSHPHSAIDHLGIRISHTGEPLCELKSDQIHRHNFPKETKVLLIGDLNHDGDPMD